MSSRDPDLSVIEYRSRALEQALIDEFLRARGLDHDRVAALPAGEARRVLTDASVYAAAKLAEVDARSHFVHEIHGSED